MGEIIAGQISCCENIGFELYSMSSDDAELYEDVKSAGYNATVYPVCIDMTTDSGDDGEIPPGAPCVTDMTTFTTAEKECGQIGARLCTNNELYTFFDEFLGESSDDACNVASWSSSTAGCASGEHMTVSADGTKCEIDTGASAYRRCCSDPCMMADIDLDGEADMCCEALGWESADGETTCGSTTDAAVFGYDDAECEFTNFFDAHNMCENAHGHICSVAELESLPADTNCDTDDEYVWARDSCGTDGVTIYNKKDSDAICFEPDTWLTNEWPGEGAAVRCCANKCESGFLDTITEPEKSCSDLGWTVDGDACSNGSCAFERTWLTSLFKCLEDGASLCPADEMTVMEESVCAEYLDTPVWTSTPCTTSKGKRAGFIAKTNGNAEGQCFSADSVLATQCCAKAA